MKPNPVATILLALASAAALSGCWGSTKGSSVEVGPGPEPALVGSQNCTQTCHASTTDHVTGLGILATWSASPHTNNPYVRVECEGCHGGGGEHFGIGPIPYPEATQGCAKCHGGHDPSFLGFAETAHYNPNGEPAALFFQPDASTDNALYFGNPEFRPDNATKVTRAEHIQQCSVCHNPTRQFVFAKAPTRTSPGGDLLKPSPSALPVPRVGCAGCHNGHDPFTRLATVPQRPGGVVLPTMRDYLVDSAGGSRTDCTVTGVQLSTLDLFHQPNGAVQPNGSIDYARVVGRNNEIHPDRLCASCHARGKYLWSGKETHQEDVWKEWSESGHGNRNAPAFAEFSANPPAYTDVYGDPYEVGTHRTTYPWDMNLSAESAVSATAARNGTYIPVGETSAVDGYACYKCHHGLGSIAYQDNVEKQGDNTAPVLLGDVTVTCITCHSPHTPSEGTLTRRPKVMTKVASFKATATGTTPEYTYPGFSGNVFLDNTPLPSSAGDVSICIFCHQGRESGLTLFYRKLYDNANLASAFTNPHYLGTGAMMWGRNGFEYGGLLYGVNLKHQERNCNGCHMTKGVDNEELGGHTWEPAASTCNASSCHAGEVDNTLGHPDTAGFRRSDDTTNYLGTTGGEALSIAATIQALEKDLLLLLAAMPDNAIYFNDTEYPYAHRIQDPALQTRSTGFTRFRPSTMKACFNLQYVIKGLPSRGKSGVWKSLKTGGIVADPSTWPDGTDVLSSDSSAMFRPNSSGAVHNYRYIIQLLMDSYTDVYNETVARFGTGWLAGKTWLPAPSSYTRPPGSRPAVNYVTPGGTSYDPRQVMTPAP